MKKTWNESPKCSETGSKLLRNRTGTVRAVPEWFRSYLETVMELFPKLNGNGYETALKLRWI